MFQLLDIGSGKDPHPKASVILEKYLDVSKHRAGKTLAQIKSGITVIGDGCYLPFKDKSFKTVYSRHVIEHVDDPEKFISECRRVSVENIKIIFPSLFNEIHRHLIFDDDMFGVHKWAYNPTSKKWLDFIIIREKEPAFTRKQKIYLKFIRMLPRRLKHMIISPYMYILGQYYKEFGLFFEENEIN